MSAARNTLMLRRWFPTPHRPLKSAWALLAKIQAALTFIEREQEARKR